MTVSYTAEVATSGFGCFLKLLLRWRASIYKIIWLDFVMYLMAYYTLNLSYRFLMNQEQKTKFELVVKYCSSSSTLIPLSFVLGFYVTVVMTRWWDQYLVLPWPDPLAVYVSTLVVGQDERCRAMRRTIMRYVCLTLTMVLTMVSPPVKRRFLTLGHLVAAGILTENEKDVLESMEEKQQRQAKHWVPMVWAASIVSRARKEGRVREDVSLKSIIDELDEFRSGCAMILHYDSVPIPLVYTQVVTLAVYSYFLGTAFGHQWTDTKDPSGYKNLVDFYFPIFTMLEFFFYMGWLKVAECLMNPFGDDDDDFELNWLIDRNLQVSYLIVDEMHHEHPQLVKDQYWDETMPSELPYPSDLAGREEPPEHSTAKYDIKPTTVDTESGLAFTPKNPDVSMHYSLATIFKRKPSREDSSRTQLSIHSSSSSKYEVKVVEQPNGRHLSLVYSDHHMEPKKSITERRAEASTEFKLTPTISLPSLEVVPVWDDGQDHFEILKAERERQRTERQKQKLLQNAYVAATATVDRLRLPTGASETTSNISKDRKDDSKKDVNQTE